MLPLFIKLNSPTFFCGFLSQKLILLSLRTKGKKMHYILGALPELNKTAAVKDVLNVNERSAVRWRPPCRTSFF